MSTTLSLLRLACWGALVPLVACCPPLRSDFSTPEATLDTWQAHLCHDVPEGEYRCLSAGLQAAMYGFPSYFAAREKLLRDDPLAAFFLERADLADHVAERSSTADGTGASLVFDERGRRLAIDFVLETAIRLEFEDGSESSARVDGPLWTQVNSLSGRQWIDLRAPRLSAARREALRRIELVQQWKIAAIQGLEAVRPAASAVAP